METFFFVHVELGGDAYSNGKTLCTIPQAIFTRMTTYNQEAYLSNKDTERSGFNIPVRCKDGNLITMSSIRAEYTFPRLLLTWYYLKDI